MLRLQRKKNIEIRNVEHVFFSNTVTTVTFLTNIRIFSNFPKVIEGWASYVAGATLAAGHFAFLSDVTRTTKAMMDNDGKGHAVVK